VIRTIETALSSSINGKISQPGVLITITATWGSMSYSTVANVNGEFTISWLPPGSYTLTINPLAPFNASTVNNITVAVGAATNVGVITI